MIEFLPEYSSRLIILLSSSAEIIISSKTGTDAPQAPVFPPCGHTANLF